MTQPKMVIHTALGLDGYENCHPIDSDNYEVIMELIDGRPRSATWKPLAMQIFQEDEDGNKLRRSDSPWLGGDSLIFRPAAVLALGKLLRAHGELLPLRCQGTELWMYNPWLVDALDEDASTLWRYDNGRIMAIRKPVFRPDRIRGVHAFKVPNKRACTTYLSQQFVDAWHAADLKGLEFRPVWTEP